MASLIKRGINVFVEIGPKPVLLGMGRRLYDNDGTWLPTLRQNDSDWSCLISTVAQLYVRGVEIDWVGFAPRGDDNRDYAKRRKKVVLPTYPWKKQRYWVDMPRISRRSEVLRPLIDKMTTSPLLSKALFESEFSVEALPFLSDHQVYGAVVSPAACHLAMVLSAVELAFGSPSCQIEDVIFPQALMVPEDEARTVQL